MWEDDFLPSAKTKAHEKMKCLPSTKKHNKIQFCGELASRLTAKINFVVSLPLSSQQSPIFPRAHFLSWPLAISPRKAHDKKMGSRQTSSIFTQWFLGLHLEFGANISSWKETCLLIINHITLATMDPTGVGSGDEKYQEHNEPNQGITGG